MNGRRRHRIGLTPVQQKVADIGGAWGSPASTLASSNQGGITPSFAGGIGFRVVSVVPEPGAIAGTLAGLFILLGASARRCEAALRRARKTAAGTDFRPVQRRE